MPTPPLVDIALSPLAGSGWSETHLRMFLKRRGAGDFFLASIFKLEVAKKNLLLRVRVSGSNRKNGYIRDPASSLLLGTPPPHYPSSISSLHCIVSRGVISGAAARKNGPHSSSLHTRAFRARAGPGWVCIYAG